MRKTIKGFTIVELVVVLVVMGLLVAISVSSYSNWQKSNVITTIKSDLNGAAAAMDNQRLISNSYPASPPASFKSSNGVVVIGGSMDGGSTYCLSAEYTQTGVSYLITSDNKTPRIGVCVLNQTLVSSSKNMSSNYLTSGRTCAESINYSVSSLTINTAILSSVPTTGCLSVGDEVLIINLQGTISNSSNVGNFETKIISNISSNTITFSTNKTKYYGDGVSNDLNIGVATTNQRVMLQRVPNYLNFAVNSGVTVTANAWDGVKGGVLALRSSGRVDIDGTINMSGKGWRGGLGGYWYGGAGESYNGGPTPINLSSSMNANGGGGGGGGSAGLVDGGTGAAGGAGYATTGTNGGRGRYSPTIGYGGNAYGSSNLSQIFLGSGGGGNCTVDSLNSQSGGVGGGIIIIFGNSINITGSVIANGMDGFLSGQQSSGGSGGSIYLSSGSTVSVGSNIVTAKAGVSGNGATWSPPTYYYGQSGPSSSGRIRITGTLTGATNPSAYNG